MNAATAAASADETYLTAGQYSTVLGPISRESDAGLISENITKTPSILQIITFYILDFLRNFLL
jgi:hypothetical protein